MISPLARQHGSRQGFQLEPKAWPIGGARAACESRPIEPRVGGDDARTLAMGLLQWGPSMPVLLLRRMQMLTALM